MRERQAVLLGAARASLSDEEYSASQRVVAVGRFISSIESALAGREQQGGGRWWSG